MCCDFLSFDKSQAIDSSILVPKWCTNILEMEIVIESEWNHTFSYFNYGITGEVVGMWLLAFLASGSSEGNEP